MKFKHGDKVKYDMGGGNMAYGEVTIALEDRTKVIFAGQWDLDYWYYPNHELELVSEEDYNNATRLR